MIINGIAIGTLILAAIQLCSCGDPKFRQTGMDLELECYVIKEIIVWKVNGLEIPATSTSGGGGNIKSTLVVKNLTPNDSGLYECLTTEDVSIDTFNVTVLSISGESRDLVGNMSVAELSCKVDNMDVMVTSIEWMRMRTILNSTDKYKVTVDADGSSTSLEISKPSDADVGPYTCAVTIEDSEKNEYTFTANFSLNTGPKVQPIDKLRSKVEGEKATIVCNVTGFPTPDVEWYIRLEDEAAFQPVTYDDRVNATAKDGVPNAVLVITDLKIKQDRGDYTCVAKNFLGSANATATLKVKDKLAAVWPFLGICAEVAILCSIIFIFEKRRNRRMEEEEEVDAVKQDLMNKTNGTEEKELRQRSNATKA